MSTALAERELDPRDQAVAELALTYARGIDLGEDLAKVGPALLATLTALLLTPAARAAALKGVKEDGQRPANPLDELRERRAARTNRAPAVDSPTPAADA